ncbi:MAG: hypothetical protein AAGI88_17705 [Pseudomonadota bacterium]
MKIVDVLKVRVASLINDDEQAVSEKLIELATFFYKIDRRVSLEEQRYIDKLMKSIDWSSSISIESHQRDCIAKVNRIVDKPEDEVFVYLSDLMGDISALGAVDKAKAVAQEISDADGEIADDEVKYLDLVRSFE